MLNVPKYFQGNEYYLGALERVFRKFFATIPPPHSSSKVTSIHSRKYCTSSLFSRRDRGDDLLIYQVPSGWWWWYSFLHPNAHRRTTSKAPTPTPIVKGKLPAPNSHEPPSMVSLPPFSSVAFLVVSAKTLRKNNWASNDIKRNKGQLFALLGKTKN